MIVDRKILREVVKLLLYSFLALYIINSYLSAQYRIADLRAVGNVSTISDVELRNVVEELFVKSSSELYRYVSVNYQGQITSRNITDNAPERFLNVSSEIFSIRTINSLTKLFDNYELDTSREEIITDEEVAEENEFINNLMATDTMLHTMYFLSTKGFFPNDSQVYKEVLKEIWFSQYSRGKGTNGSSGFEHVFLAERKSRKRIVGLHNWIFFSIGESSNKINYLGFLHHAKFLDNVAIASIYFTYDRKRKMSSMFIGTPPELEIALYTLCFFARPNKKCKVSYAGVDFDIQTYILRNGDKEHVAAAFPIIRGRLTK